VPKVEAVLIVLAGRTKAIMLPEPIDSADLKVKFSTPEGLVELQMLKPLDLRGLRVASDRRSAASKENIARATSALQSKREEGSALVSGFMAKLSPPQRAYVERLFRVLEFEDRDRAGLWMSSAAKWLSSVLECCPEPWRLDFYFLKKWLASPYTAANAAAADLLVGKTKKGRSSATMIRRAVARKVFIGAWEEQVGPATVPPNIPGLVKRVRGAVSGADNHPFTAIYLRLRDGQMPTRASFRAAVSEYVAAGLLDPAEAEEASRMIASGRWMGELAIPSV
jgi:hypothetical protein